MNYSMGYIVMCARKSQRDAEFLAPMSYGRGTEPAHGQLLRRGRATMFATEGEARKALKATLKEENAEGRHWPENFQYHIIEVENATAIHEVTAR